MKRILIAEDRSSSRELIRTVLETLGYDVMEAVDGRDAIERAEGADVDLFLLDLQMPRLDGFGVLSFLRQSERFSKTPIVALTASAMYGDRERALRAGFSSYLPKPVDLKLLRSEIERLVGGP